MKTSENSDVVAFVQQLSYPKSAAFIIACLEDIQAGFGWVSQDAMVAVAAQLNVDVARVKRIVDVCPDAFLASCPEQAALLVCNGPICRMHGADELSRQLSGQGLRIAGHACLGACDRAPAARCGHRLVAPADLPAIIRASTQGA